MYLATYNLTCELGISLKFGHIVPPIYCLGVISQEQEELYDHSQTHKFGKAIQHLFVDLVTY